MDFVPLVGFVVMNPAIVVVSIFSTNLVVMASMLVKLRVAVTHIRSFLFLVQFWIVRAVPMLPLSAFFLPQIVVQSDSLVQQSLIAWSSKA